MPNGENGKRHVMLGRRQGAQGGVRSARPWAWRQGAHIVDYLADRDDVFEGDDENEDKLRDEDIVEPPPGAGDED